KEKGFTEPNPNDDLCGVDVARKLLIIARLIGLKLNLEDIKVQSLVGISDEEMLKMVKNANEKNSVLRYVATIDTKNNIYQAKIETILNNSSLASTQGADNVISITSKYYNVTPLVIKGPGAGATVTAVGIMSDLLRLKDML
ncbi:MAG: hypothetical protein LBC92_00835, partial [Rickettsiales bacterium]|nr:hypothetical protein [Rickettsiales bacterium]